MSDRVESSGDGVAAVGFNRGIVSTGSGAKNMMVDFGSLPAASRAQCPAGLVKLSPGLSLTFVGRQKELELLDEIATTGAGPDIRVIAGEAGIGKSALASQYAKLNFARYNPVWQINAESPQSVEEGLADLASHIEPMLSAAPPEMSAKWALAWLQSHPGWLIIADNARTPEDIASLLGLPGHGRVLVTSQWSSEWNSIATTIKLGVLAEHDAVDLIASVAGRSMHIDRNEAAELSKKLRFMPSSLQAVADHMARTQTSPATYLASMQLLPATPWLDLNEIQPLLEFSTIIRGSGTSSRNYPDAAARLNAILKTQLAARLISPELLSSHWAYVRTVLSAYGLTDQQVADLRESWESFKHNKEKAAARSSVAPAISSPPPRAPFQRRRRKPLEILNSALRMLVTYLAFLVVAFIAGTAIAESSSVHHVGAGNWIALAISSCIIIFVMIAVWGELLEDVGATTTIVGITAALLLGWLLTPHIHLFHVATLRLDTVPIGQRSWLALLWRF